MTQPLTEPFELLLADALQCHALRRDAPGRYLLLLHENPAYRDTVRRLYGVVPPDRCTNETPDC